jgi:hypothetical protein
MSTDRRAEASQDEAVEETFPASDPPASMARGAARAVPPQEMMDQAGPVAGAVTLRRRFADSEAAKLALEGLVRDGPVDRDGAEIASEADGTELRLVVPPEDAERIRALLAR